MAVSFASDIVPMFTEMDVTHMGEQSVYLDKYEYMSDPTDNYANANAVYDEVSSGSMPPSWSDEDPWTPAKVQTFKDWMDGGYQP